jgi:hypothetical protein
MWGGTWLTFGGGCGLKWFLASTDIRDCLFRLTYRYRIILLHQMDGFVVRLITWVPLA